MKISKEYLKQIVREELKDLVEAKVSYKSIIQGLEKDKKEVAGKSKAFGQNDTKYIDKAINFLKQLEKEGIPANQISQVDFVTNRVPKFFIGHPSESPSLSKFTTNDVKKAVAHAKKMGIIKEAKVSPVDKKQFQSDAQEILGNMEKVNLVTKDTDFKTVNNTLRMIFAKIAGGKDSYNNRLFHKILPKKLNTDLYDNGEKNSYDSVWFSMNDAQRDTILKKAIKAKLNISEADVDENRALDNAIANRDANRANRKGIERYQDLYFGLQKLIRQVSKNNKVKGYGSELTHAFVDLLYAVEDDRLAVGEIFNALKKVKSKISKKSIKEELNSKQQLTEGTTLSGIWKGLKTRESGSHCLNGKTELFSTPGTGTIFSQFLWEISPAEGYLNSSSIDSEGNINKKHNYAILDGWGDDYIDDFYWWNKQSGMDIEQYVPRANAYKMNKDYQRLPLNTKIKMAHGDHKLATRFLAKYGIKPNTGK